MAEADASLHAEALAQLEAGRPLPALVAWRELLLAEAPAVQAHLMAAAAALSADAIAPLRRLAIALAEALLQSEPGASEVAALGALLRGWGELCQAEVPARALQHFERAWACGPDPQLRQQLAQLYRRLGYGEGAWELGPPAPQTEPWPQQPCQAQACTACAPQPAANRELGLTLLPQGRLWVQRHTNPWHTSHGLAVLDRHGALQPAHCRAYPQPWPRCPHRAQFEAQALAMLPWGARGLPPLQRLSGPVLAVAELSAEHYFHWQGELLPRLGRLWPLVQQQWPALRLWHNGGNTPWVAESLARLGITPEQTVAGPAHIEAELLLVPSFAADAGVLAPANVGWLQAFWAVEPRPAQGRLWLPRCTTPRRSVLGEDAWLQVGVAQPLPHGSVADQLQHLAAASAVIAPHGAGMVNLLAAAPGSAVIELVNPAYSPPYFDSLMQQRGLQHRRLHAAATPLPLQEWLYEGPLAWPIDLRPGASPAAEALAACP